MGRMVRGDHIDAAVIDRRPQGVLIVHSFDGWIAFDVGSVSSVGSVVEEEVMDAGFGRDAFLLKIARGEKRKFPCRRVCKTCSRASCRRASSIARLDER